MTVFEIACFKKFLFSQSLQSLFIGFYRSAQKIDENPEMIEKYLIEADARNVFMRAFYFLPNSDFGFDYWSYYQMRFIDYVKTKREEGGERNGSVSTLTGTYKSLRINLDSVDYWKKETKYETARRMKLDTKKLYSQDPDADVLSADGNRKEEKTSAVVEGQGELESFFKEKENGDHDDDKQDIFGQFEFVDVAPKSNEARRLKDNELSINTRGKRGRATFSQALTKEIKARGGYEYASLLKNKAGDVVLLLNDQQGVPLANSINTEGNYNVQISSKSLVQKLVDLLNIKKEYEIVELSEIEKTKEYVAYIVTKKPEL